MQFVRGDAIPSRDLTRSIISITSRRRFSIRLPQNDAYRTEFSAGAKTHTQSPDHFRLHWARNNASDGNRRSLDTCGFAVVQSRERDR